MKLLDPSWTPEKGYSHALAIMQKIADDERKKIEQELKESNENLQAE